MRGRAAGWFAPAILAVWLASGGGWLAGQDARNETTLPVVQVDHGVNSAAARKAHYVVLV